VGRAGATRAPRLWLRPSGYPLSDGSPWGPRTIAIPGPGRCEGYGRLWAKDVNGGLRRAFVQRGGLLGRTRCFGAPGGNARRDRTRNRPACPEDLTWFLTKVSFVLRKIMTSPEELIASPAIRNLGRAQGPCRTMVEILSTDRPTTSVRQSEGGNLEGWSKPPCWGRSRNLDCALAS
jgi:hypothetical protein